MRRAVGLGLVLVLGVVACSGSTGPAGATGATGAKGAAGAPGAPGAKGTGAEGDGGAGSVSVVSPPFAFQDRTVDLSIAGSGTSWDAKTTVSFANPKVTVNKVTVASSAGLIVNITVAGDAALGATDITVTDGATKTVYSNAFQVEAPITVTVTPTTGVPQGGLANLHVQMNDLTTPIDPDTIAVTLSSPDVAMSQPSPTDYAFDLTIEADVLAKPGTFDLTVTFGGTTTITSPAPKSFAVTARTPTKLTTTAPATGNLNTELDTELYEFTPASASQSFLQFTTSSMAGELAGTVVPSSGMYADAITTFAIRYGQGITSASPFFVVVGDSNGLFGAGPVPADTTLVTFESACTAANEITETSGKNDDTYMTAESVTALPALVNGALGYGSVDGTMDTDVYSFTVPATAKSIHVATGGDPNSDTVIAILDGTGTSVATSDDLDFQEDLSYTLPAGASGTYYATVVASAAGNFSDSDNTYQLFIATN